MSASEPSSVAPGVPARSSSNSNSNSGLLSLSPHSQHTVDWASHQDEPFTSSSAHDAPNALMTLARSDSLRTTVSATSVLPTPPTKKEHRPRKGHRKSRCGCYNCKRRKIKCQEVLPACDNCRRKNLECVYPERQRPLLEGVLLGHAQAPVMQPQSTPMIFTMVDMRLFHHFMLHAFPLVPLSTTAAWIYDIPAVAHQNEHLMHAILGLAASHIGLVTGEDMSGPAMHHRYLAIKGSNEVLSQKLKGSDGDALLGTCYALTFQSSYMMDGLAEHLTMTRSCATLSRQLKREGLKIIFEISDVLPMERMDGQMPAELPVISSELINGAAESLRACASVCREPGVLRDFHQKLSAVPEALEWSSMQGYHKFQSVFQSLGDMSTADFIHFIDVNNEDARILLAHFTSLQLVFAPLMDREWSGRTMKSPVRGLLAWITTTYNNTSYEKKGYVEWPKAIAEYARMELDENPTKVPFVEVLRKREGYSRGLL
ncbi:C6 zinc finger protein [Phlyctema vagabunda]|uniref:C6 zinc finger protein n=1 Tax=Phlyctema vagabunda TaxID=108571 RepID=A0ABR4PZ47_9HELO